MERFSPISHIPRYSRLLIKAMTFPLCIYLTLGGNFVMVIASILFWHFENGVNPAVTHWLDGFWWAVCTVSTVGYGDIVPVTNAGKIVGVGLIFLGIGFFLSFLTVVVTVMTSLATEEFEILEQRSLRRIQNQLEEIKELINK